MTDFITTNKDSSASMEEALIGSVLRNGKAFERVREIVAPDQFVIHSYGYVWTAIKNLHERGLCIDTLTVGDELERMVKMGELDEYSVSRGSFSGRALLANLRENGNPSSVESYAENIQDYAVKRYLLEVANKMAYYAQNGRRSHEIIQDVEKLFSEITLYGGKSESHTKDFSEAVRESFDWTDRAAAGKIIGVPTGYPDLDNILGGLYGGNLYIVAARPGQGKTALLLSMARNIAKGKKNTDPTKEISPRRVGVFSIEMSSRENAMRIIAQESQIDLSRIMKGKLHDSEWPVYTNAVEICSSLPITINDMGAISIAEIRQEARKMKARAGLDIAMVDYLQIAEVSENKERRDLDIGQITSGLKALAKELDIPIIAASQLSRELEKRSEKRPMLSDLRESGSIENDADVVMFIYREDQYNPKSDKAGIAEIIIAKHRNGPVGSVDLVYRAPFTRFDSAATKIFNVNQ